MLEFQSVKEQLAVFNSVLLLLSSGIMSSGGPCVTQIPKISPGMGQTGDQIA